jgi:hypothetical protein
MTHLKIIGLYLLATFVFVVSWLREQPHALEMANLNSFAEAHDIASKMVRQRKSRKEHSND